MKYGTKEKIRIAYFGTFFPNFLRNAPINTGLVYLLQLSKEISNIDLYSTRDAILPMGFSSRVNLINSWEIDDVVSIIRTLVKMYLRRSITESYFFNLSLSNQGKSKIVNFVSLICPIILSISTRKRVLVYLHELIETLDFPAIGLKKPNFFIFSLVKLLERLLILKTKVVLPMFFQLDSLEGKYRRSVKQLYFPYAEAVWAFDIFYHSVEQINTSNIVFIPKILLFGSWGPKKDILGLLKVLEELKKSGLEFDLTIAGSINSNFADYSDKLMPALESISKYGAKIILMPNEEKVPDIFMNADGIILPYLTSVGISGVMNIAAFYDLSIISYDLPELRQFNSMIGARTIFIKPNDILSLKEAIMNVKKISSAERTNTIRLKRYDAIEKINQLVKYLLD
jgi:glycosyltransferase involved in cell wall biosynthesis